MNKKNTKVKNNFFAKNKKKIVLIILMIIIIYAICISSMLLKNPVDTVLIENGKLYLEEATAGYIIRNETIVEGENYKNGIVPIKTEGERVSKGDSIFRYYSNSEDNLVEKIQDLDKKIQEAMSKENNLFSSDIKLLDSQIESKLNDIYELNDLQKITEYKNDINTYITKKAKIAGELSPAGSYIKKLIDERSEYEKSLNNNSEYVTAPISGLVSYRVDGLENVLTTDDFSKISKQFLENLNVKTSQVIASSSEKGKVIDNFECYIATIVNSEEAKKAEVGDKIKIRLPNSKEVDAKIEYIQSETDDVVIVLKIQECVEELISYRKITFDIIWWSASGLKVPNSAIIYENDLACVVRDRAGYLEKIYVKVLKQNDKYSIVSNYSSNELEELGYDSNFISNKKSISLYDEIIVKVTEDKLKSIK